MPLQAEPSRRESGCLSIRLPLPLSIAVTTTALAVAGLVLRIGIPISRQRTAIREFNRFGGILDFEPVGPDWIRNWVGEKWAPWFDVVSRATFESVSAADAIVNRLKTLRPVPELYVKYAPPIHEFLKHGQIEKARAALGDHPSLLYARDDLQLTPLHVAVGYGEIEDGERAGIVKFLLESGAEIDAIAYNGLTPLHLAEDPETASVLISRAPNLNAVGAGETPLQRNAYKYAHYDPGDRQKWRSIANYLLAAGADYDLRSACYLDDVARVRELVKQPRHARDTQAFAAAAAYGRIEIVKILLDHGADPRDALYGLYSKCFAVRHTKVVEILLDAGADSHFRMKHFDATGWTLLHQAAELDAVETAQPSQSGLWCQRHGLDRKNTSACGREFRSSRCHGAASRQSCGSDCIRQPRHDGVRPRDGTISTWRRPLFGTAVDRFEIGDRPLHLAGCAR